MYSGNVIFFHQFVIYNFPTEDAWESATADYKYLNNETLKYGSIKIWRDSLWRNDMLRV